jgi:hypothetical protein
MGNKSYERRADAYANRQGKRFFLLFKIKKREAAETTKTREKIGQKQVGKF